MICVDFAAGFDDLTGPSYLYSRQFLYHVLFHVIWEVTLLIMHIILIICIISKVCKTFLTYRFGAFIWMVTVDFFVGCVLLCPTHYVIRHVRCVRVSLRVTVRKQTGPQRLHKSRDTKFTLYIWILRKYYVNVFFFFFSSAKYFALSRETCASISWM